jgi:hypothetical protein
MKAKLYLETTIPSYLVANSSPDARLAADQEQTIEWWELHRARFEVYISAVVLREIARGNPDMAGKRMEKVAGIPLLSPNIESELLAERLLAKVIPPNAADDAAHIALAAVHQMDFLLTWNCKHINNRFTIRRVENICSEMGYQCPVISTPTELMSIEI